MRGWTNESVDELSKLLHQLLPPNSTFPTKWRACKVQITKLGLRYENIHTCVNGCVLFCKKIASETKCPKCKEGRYTSELKSNSSPRKVLDHFPLIPQFLRMYRCKDIVELIQCHAKIREPMENDDLWMILRYG
jgi:hypothetical protein